MKRMLSILVTVVMLSGYAYSADFIVRKLNDANPALNIEKQIEVTFIATVLDENATPVRIQGNKQNFQMSELNNLITMTQSRLDMLKAIKTEADKVQ